MNPVKSAIKRTIQFLIALVGAVFAISLYVSLSVLTSNWYNLKLRGNWVNTFKPTLGVAAAVLLFMGVEKFLWRNVQPSPAKREHTIIVVAVMAAVPVILIGCLLLIAGLVALAGG